MFGSVSRANTGGFVICAVPVFPNHRHTAYGRSAEDRKQRADNRCRMPVIGDGYGNEARFGCVKHKEEGERMKDEI